jgi:hypothetical protein
MTHEMKTSHQPSIGISIRGQNDYDVLFAVNSFRHVNAKSIFLNSIFKLLEVLFLHRRSLTIDSSTDAVLYAALLFSGWIACKPSETLQFCW